MCCNYWRNSCKVISIVLTVSTYNFDKKFLINTYFLVKAYIISDITLLLGHYPNITQEKAMKMKGIYSAYVYKKLNKLTPASEKDKTTLQQALGELKEETYLQLAPQCQSSLNYYRP